MEQYKKCSICGGRVEEGEDRCKLCSEQPNVLVQSVNGEPNKQSNKNIYVLIGVLVIAFVLTMCIVFLKSTTASEQVVYVKDGELHSLSTADNKKVQLSNDIDYETDYLSTYSIYKSDDNQFVFYPNSTSEYDDSTYYWRDMTKDNNKSDSSVRVDSEIHGDRFLTADGNTFFYLKGSENRLYLYDRKSGEKTKLDDEVEAFYVNDKGDYLVYRTYQDDVSALYEMVVKGMTGTKSKLDTNSYIYYTDMNNKSIIYEKEGILYRKTFDKEKTKLVSNYDYLPEIYSDNHFYYLKSEEITSKLIDLVEDDLVALDSQVNEPEYPNFPPSPDYPDESDYLVKEWVDSIYGDEQHSETNEWGYWESLLDEAAYDKAYEEYRTKYDEWEIQYDKLADEYNNALDRYDAKVERVLLREELEDENNAITFNQYALYYVNKGKETLVASNISNSLLYSSSNMPFIVYNKMSNSIDSKQKLSTLIEDLGWYGVDEFIDELKNNTENLQVLGKEVYVTYGEKEQILDVVSDDVYTYRLNDSGNLYMITDYDVDKEKGVLMKITTKDGIVSKASLVDEDVALMPYDIASSQMYYIKNWKNGSGDLYLEGNLVAEDVYVHSLYVFDDNQILYYKEYSNNKFRGTLTLNKNGKETKISDDASMFVPIDQNHIVFLYDYNYERERGDLMIYTGKSKPTLIDTDVKGILGIYY